MCSRKFSRLEVIEKYWVLQHKDTERESFFTIYLTLTENTRNFCYAISFFFERCKIRKKKIFFFRETTAEKKLKLQFVLIIFFGETTFGKITFFFFEENFRLDFVLTPKIFTYCLKQLNNKKAISGKNNCKKNG